MKRIVLVLCLFAAAFAVEATLTAPLAGQEIVLRGASDVSLDRRLRRVLREDPIVVTRDTMITAADTVPRPLLVLGEVTVIIEGVLLGDLVLVQGGAFVRPGARIAGDAVNMNGGLYISQLATVGGEVVDVPQASYVVVEEEGRLVIVASDAPSPLQLDGLRGLRIPTYDRANGVTLAWGGTLWLPMLGSVQPFISGFGGWRTELGEPIYGGEAGLRMGAYTLSGGYALESVTNDEWIRGDLMNSLNYLLSGKDYRDYNEVERAWAGVTRQFGGEAKSLLGEVSARFQVEDASSLPADDPWFILGDTTRTNPAIDEGRITSVVGEVQVDWEGREAVADGRLVVEHALDAMDGQFAFTRATLDADWAVHALANHTVEIDVHAQAPLRGETMPRQRWGFVGGSGTLQTLEFAEFYGDHVVFVETTYIIPLPERISMPILGAPSLEFLHAAGMAWSEDTERDLHQEIGARLQFFALYVRYMVEPSDLGNADLDIGLSWPFDGVYPWQR